MMEKVLIYDADCPLCRAYTKGLVLTGALPAACRVASHSPAGQQLIGQLDPVRSRHEIPLLDTETGQAQYGVEAIVTVLQRTWPRLSRFVRHTLLLAVARQAYAFVSYNRRLLFPTPPDRPHVMDLAPDFNVGHRVAFLLLLGTLLAGVLAPGGYVTGPVLGTLLAHLLLTGAYIFRHSSASRLASLLDYLGHLGMSLLIGGVVRYVGMAADWPALGWLGGAVMLWQHQVRLRSMRMPAYLNLPLAVFVWLSSYPV